MVKKNEQPQDKSKLQDLSTGLLMSYVKKQMDDPGYQAIGQMTYEQDVFSKRHTYCGEIRRVLDELELTTELLNAINEKETKRPPEELITYYDGVFLDQIHQLKDKVLRMLDVIAAIGPLPVAYAEPKEAKVGKLRHKYGQTLEAIGISDLVDEWQEGENTIGTALRKRTKHHHYASRLRLNDDFHKTQLSRMMLQPSAAEQLTEYGKQRMTELGQESLKKLKDDTVAKQRNTLVAVKANLETMADKLLTHYDLRIDFETQAKITADYMQFLGTAEIKNETGVEKIPKSVEGLLASVSEMLDGLGDRVVSAYLVGSAARGEFIPGSSDLTIYVIMKNYSNTFGKLGIINLVVLSEEDFLSEDHLRDRFICWSDGLLLRGKRFEFDASVFPHPGGLLAMLLNKGVIERLEEIQSEIEALDKPTNLQLRLYSLRVSRIMLDYLFGVAMTNKPYYSPSRKRKIEHMKQQFPGQYLTLTLERIYYGALVSYEDLKLLVQGCLGSIRKTYPDLVAIETKVKADEEKRHG